MTPVRMSAEAKSRDTQSVPATVSDKVCCSGGEPLDGLFSGHARV